MQRLIGAHRVSTTCAATLNLPLREEKCHAIFLVLRYQVDWRTKDNAYRVLVQFAPNTKPVALPINSETEFIAALIMLGKAGVMIR